MHRILLTLCLLLALPFVALADNKQTLTIDGTAQQATVKSIAFSGDNVVLSLSDGTSQTVDMASVVINFGTSTGIQGLVKSLSGLQLVGDALTLRGAEAGTAVAVYNLRGVRQAQGVAGQDATVLSLVGLPKGVYVVKAGKQSVKFIKR